MRDESGLMKYSKYLNSPLYTITPPPLVYGSMPDIVHVNTDL